MKRIAIWFYTVIILSSVYMLCMFFHVYVMRKHFQFLFLHGHSKIFEDKDVQSYTCPSNISKTHSEDILCMKREKFLTNFKNPCWFKFINTTQGPKKELRCFPFFHIFGVCKSGTTDLFFRLTQHPQILNNTGVLNKETQFWSWKRFGQDSSDRRNLTLDDFSRFFRANKIGRTKIGFQMKTNYSDLITGHSDPMDFLDHNHWREIPQNDPNSNEPKFLTPHFVRHVQPNIKLILLLREPAERLYSHYLHGHYGETPEEFHNAVLKGTELLRSCLSNNSLKTCLYKSDLSKDMKLPLSASLYYIHLQEWLDVFLREQFLVLRTEDYQKDTKNSLLQLFTFLGVGDIYLDVIERIVKMPHKYETKSKIEQGSMLKETWDILIEFFKEPNRRLAAVLNDERFLWKDALFKFRAKEIPKTEPASTTSSVLDHNIVNKSKSKNTQQIAIPIRRKLTKMSNNILNQSVVNKNNSGVQRSPELIPKTHTNIPKQTSRPNVFHNSTSRMKLKSTQRVPFTEIPSLKKKSNVSHKHTSGSVTQNKTKSIGKGPREKSIKKSQTLLNQNTMNKTKESTQLPEQAFRMKKTVSENSYNLASTSKKKSTRRLITTTSSNKQTGKG
ncbi:carbohydrate sulfotransferase 15-like [Saccostrea cucullata]|uniref:carbohydrate sulfotransferase 15-like n=1 Tax=Saccostrea cuccullata TaxID=36930 RepID=UPI002ED223E3